MARPDVPDDAMNPIEPLIGSGSADAEAAETMLAASQTMLAAANALSASLGPGGARERELTAQAIESGFLSALRRGSLLDGAADTSAAASLLGLPTGQRIPGTSYGRMGASITGSGSRAQLYGSVGGAIGYAVGGPVGALLGGMLGAWLGGGDDDGAEQARRQEELRRQWLNTPEGFEVQAYLYNLARGYRVTGSLVPPPQPQQTSGRTAALPDLSRPVIVNLSAGAVQITGSDAAAGERAARAFAGSLGRVLRLNSVVVPAAGFGGGL